jgi:hypothetical protein
MVEPWNDVRPTGYFRAKRDGIDSGTNQARYNTKPSSGKLEIEFSEVKTVSALYRLLNVDAKVEAKFSVSDVRGSASLSSMFSRSRTSYTYVGHGRITFAPKGVDLIEATPLLKSNISEYDSSEVSWNEKIEFCRGVGSEVVSEVTEGIFYAVVYNFSNLKKTTSTKFRAHIEARYSAVKGEANLLQIMREVDSTATVRARIYAPVLINVNPPGTPSISAIRSLIQNQGFSLKNMLDAISKLFEEAVKSGIGNPLEYNSMPVQRISNLTRKERKFLTGASKVYASLEREAIEANRDIARLDKGITSCDDIASHIPRDSSLRKKIEQRRRKLREFKYKIRDQFVKLGDVQNPEDIRYRSPDIPIIEYDDLIPNNFSFLKITGWQIVHEGFWMGPANHSQCKKRTLAWPQLVFSADSLIFAIDYLALRDGKIVEKFTLDQQGIETLKQSPRHFATLANFLIKTPYSGAACSGGPYHNDANHRIGVLIGRIRDRSHWFRVTLQDGSKREVMFPGPKMERIRHQINTVRA